MDQTFVMGDNVSLAGFRGKHALTVCKAGLELNFDGFGTTELETFDFDSFLHVDEGTAFMDPAFTFGDGVEAGGDV